MLAKFDSANIIDVAVFDRGGTFTDVIGHRSDGQLVIHKLLSEDTRYSAAAIQGICDVMEIKNGEALPLQYIGGWGSEGV